MRPSPRWVDAIWRASSVAVELDGHRAHRTRAQTETDRRRELRLRAAGYTVVRYTEQQLAVQQELVRADLSKLLQATRRDAASARDVNEPPPAHRNIGI
jgi:very-short-patch-repair endonuclease